MIILFSLHFTFLITFLISLIGFNNGILKRKMIKFSKLNINNKDIALVSKIIKSGWLSHGKYTSRLEKNFVIIQVQNTP